MQRDVLIALAWVHADQAKGGEAIGVPLNDEVVAVLRVELGNHPLCVFTFKGSGADKHESLEECTQARRHQEFPPARLAARMGNWHVMAGTTMAELPELGARKSAEMVTRYAHFAQEQLRAAADKLPTFSYTPPKNLSDYQSFVAGDGRRLALRDRDITPTIRKIIEAVAVKYCRGIKPRDRTVASYLDDNEDKFLIALA